MDSFNDLARMIGVSMNRNTSLASRIAMVKLASLFDELMDYVYNAAFKKTSVKNSLTALLEAITEIDPRLSVSDRDSTWIDEALAKPDARQIVQRMLRSAMADGRFISMAEAAERSGNAESQWRNQCAAGAVPGAFKIGKTWLLDERFVTWLQETQGQRVVGRPRASV